MNGMISWGLHTLQPIPVSGLLRKEIEHWLFLETWDAPLPWRDKRHFCVSLATDACGVHNTSGLPMAHSETRYQSEEIHSWIKTWMIKTCSKLNWDFPFFYYADKSHLWLKNLAIFLSSRSNTSCTVLVQKSVT